TDNLSLAKQLICCFLIKRLQDGQSSILQASAQITCAHCQRTVGSGLSAVPVSFVVSVEASRPL
ncbi:hypothetical protein, partial [Xanthomonas vasicola]|uniref:hypothetical protein n=1 Tax=Xanthomonas vasicola TaxID=56459 RepID=UPI001C47BE50